MSSVPNPLGELTTGIRNLSTSRVSSGAASEMVMPWPAKINGRSAAASSSAARSTSAGEAAVRELSVARSETGTSTSAVSWKTS